MRVRSSFLGALLGTAFAATTAMAAPVNLITNSGFETGDFTGWTQFGNTTFNGVSCAPGFGAGSACAAFFGPILTAGGISQTLTGLTAGGDYSLDFQLSSAGDVPSSIEITFGGTTVFGVVNPPSTGPVGAYGTFHVDLHAALSTQTLSFSFRDDPGFFLLDNVAVTVAETTGLPEPGMVSLVGVALAGMGLARRRRQH